MSGPPSTEGQGSGRRGENGFRRAALVIGTILGVLATALLACTIIPPVWMFLIPPSIFGRECAVWFLGLGFVVLALVAWPTSRRRWLRRIALACGLGIIGISAWTLAQVPTAISAAESAMIAAFGPRYAGISAGPLQPAPLSWRALLGGLPPAECDETTGIPYTDGETPLRCDLYRPRRTGPHPLVVVIHGGAWDSGDRREGAVISRSLAGSGFVVIAIDYRLAPAHRCPAQLADIHRLLTWLTVHAAAYGGDPTRIALLGRSAGAQLACTAAATEGHGVAAVVGFYSPVDLTLGYREPGFPDPVDARTVFRRFLGGTPDEVPELYRAASPIIQADRITVPTLLVTGGRDHLVDISFTRRLAERIRAKGTAVGVIDLPWSEHAFDAVSNGLGSQIALHHLIRFLRLTLGTPTGVGGAQPPAMQDP